MADPRASAPVVLTAQDLRTGAIVYWDGDGWATTLAAAAVARDADSRTALQALTDAANAGTLVIDAFLVEIAEGAGDPVPRRHREARREAGPSIAYGPRRAA